MTDDRQPPIDEDEAIAVVVEAVEVAYVEGFVDGLSDEPPPEATMRTAADSAKQFDAITNHLKRSINQQRLVAVLLSIGAVVVTVFAIGNLPEASRVGLLSLIHI